MTSSPPVLDPTPAQIRAAAQVWHDDDETSHPELSQDDVQVLQEVLTAPTPYAALCRINGIDPDARGRWEFAGDSYRRVADTRAAAAATTTTSATPAPPGTSGPAAERSQDMSEMQTTFTTGKASGGKSPGMPGGSLIGGDLATVGRAQESARRADALAEQVQIVLGMVHGAASTLADRVAAADWGTDGITRVADTISDTVSSQSTLNSELLTGLLEQFGEMDGEISSAEQLGAEVLAKQADGKAEAFVDA